MVKEILCYLSLCVLERPWKEREAMGTPIFVLLAHPLLQMFANQNESVG